MNTKVILIFSLCFAAVSIAPMFADLSPRTNYINSTTTTTTTRTTPVTNAYPNNYYNRPTTTVSTPTTTYETQGSIVIPGRRSSYTPTTTYYNAQPYSSPFNVSPYNLNSNYINDTSPASGDAPHFPNGSNASINRFYNGDAINQFYN